MKNFKTFKSLLLLSSSLSCLLVGVAVTSLAGCDSKPRSNAPHDCQKYPAGHINPSKPVPKPKPKPKPKADDFQKILVKHSDGTNPFLLDGDSKLVMASIEDEVSRNYLIKNLAPKLKYDYTKVTFGKGIETDPDQPHPIIGNSILQNDLTKIRALFITTPHHQVGIDFWVFAQT